MPKLLFDENLSAGLPRLLSATFPGSAHVRDLGLARADDVAIWDYAKANGLVIVTKDDDFRQFSFLFGPPPKVIWVNLGNCSTSQVAEVLVARADTIRQFLGDPEGGILVLGVIA